MFFRKPLITFTQLNMVTPRSCSVQLQSDLQPMSGSTSIVLGLAQGHNSYSNENGMCCCSPPHPNMITI